MTDGNELTSALPMAFWSHPAALAGAEWFVAAYQPSTQMAAGTADAALAPWLPGARVAPPGPAYAALSTQFTLVSLDTVVEGPVQEAQPPPILTEALLPEALLPEALLDDADVLGRIAKLADPHAPTTVDPVPPDDVAGGYDEPPETLPNVESQEEVEPQPEPVLVAALPAG